jgi:L-ascorbate metabolism protein UlaG (beta-lactamase superfamily)
VSADRITYVGHATVLVELGGIRLLTDPLLRARVLHIRRHADPPEPEVAERLDAVLISHLHHDHLDFPSLRRLPTATPIVVPRGGGSTLRRRGFERVVELGPGEDVRFGGAQVTATPAAHDGARYPFGRAVEAIGFDIRAGRRVYFAGDTDLFEGMRDLAGGLDVALLPIGGWGGRVGRGHLDPRRAAQAAAVLRPRIVVPIHWGTLLRIGLERRGERILRSPARRFVTELRELAPAAEAAVLDPGRSLALDPVAGG